MRVTVRDRAEARALIAARPVAAVLSRAAREVFAHLRPAIGRRTRPAPDRWAQMSEDLTRCTREDCSNRASCDQRTRLSPIADSDTHRVSRHGGDRAAPTVTGRPARAAVIGAGIVGACIALELQ